MRLESKYITFRQEIAHENVACEMVVKFSRPQCAKEFMGGQIMLCPPAINARLQRAHYLGIMELASSHTVNHNEAEETTKQFVLI